MRLRTLFSKADLEAIQTATAAGESRTAGEIVPYIVERVVDRDTARWRGATLGALGAALAAGLANAFGDFWGGFGVWWITLPAVVGAGMGYLVAGFDAVGRRLIPEDHIDHSVHLRAKAAFLEEEVFATRDRTGILVFLALFEHRGRSAQPRPWSRRSPAAVGCWNSTRSNAGPTTRTSCPTRHGSGSDDGQLTETAGSQVPDARCQMPDARYQMPDTGLVTA